MTLKYGDYILPPMWTNITGMDMKKILDTIPQLDNDNDGHGGVLVNRHCDDGGYCDWLIKFIGLVNNNKNNYKKFTITLDSASTEHIGYINVNHLSSNIITLDADSKNRFGAKGPNTLKSAFTGSLEIDVSKEIVPWKMGEKKVYILPKMYLATISAYSVQVALHNAGGYNSAVTIVPSPPNPPDGLIPTMNYDEGRVDVPVQLPTKTNGAAVRKIFYNWHSYYDISMENGYEKHVIQRQGYGTSISTKCPGNTNESQPVSCTCSPSLYCKNAIFNHDDTCLVNTDESTTDLGIDTTIIIKCSPALVNVTITNYMSTRITGNEETSSSCLYENQSAIGCSAFATSGTDYSKAMSVFIKNNSSCTIPKDQGFIGSVSIQVRCIEIPIVIGDASVNVVDLNTKVNLKDGSVWHQASVNFTINKRFQQNVVPTVVSPAVVPILPYNIIVRVENFFGQSLPLSSKMKATAVPENIKVRVDADINGLQIIVQENENHPVTGLAEDRYLIEYWPSKVKGRSQVIKTLLAQNAIELSWKNIKTGPISTRLNVTQVASICSEAWNIKMDGTNHTDDDDNIHDVQWRLIFLHIPADLSMTVIESIKIIDKTSSDQVIPTSMRKYKFVSIYDENEINQIPLPLKTKSNLILNIPNIEYVDIVPYEVSIHSCNHFGCSIGKAANVGPPKPFVLDKVNIKWIAYDSIDVTVDQDDDTYVDEMKLSWDRSLSDKQIQRITAERLPTSTSPSDMAMIYDQSFDETVGGSTDVDSSNEDSGGSVNSATAYFSMKELKTDGNIINKQLSEFASFCLPTNGNNLLSIEKKRT